MKFSSSQFFIPNHFNMKEIGIIRCIDDLGRVVIPKEIRRTMRICEGDPSYTSLTPFDKFCFAIHSVVNRYKETAE
jgi:bifunctional DNA-binding transcriptional regulator/antitoxin component of YhaV-PrlF toxin-antitoxin module